MHHHRGSEFITDPGGCSPSRISSRFPTGDVLLPRDLPPFPPTIPATYKETFHLTVDIYPPCGQVCHRKNTLRAVTRRDRGACIGWDRSCRATVASSHPFEGTIASNVYIGTNLSHPLNLGTFVVVNATGLGRAGGAHVADVDGPDGASFNTYISFCNCGSGL